MGEWLLGINTNLRSRGSSRLAAICPCERHDDDDATRRHVEGSSVIEARVSPRETNHYVTSLSTDTCSIMPFSPFYLDTTDLIYSVELPKNTGIGL